MEHKQKPKWQEQIEEILREQGNEQIKNSLAILTQEVEPPPGILGM